MSEPKIIILDDPPALYAHAAEELSHFAGEAVCTHGEFTLCLSGGSTPAATYELLATRFHLSIDWKEVQFFWGDERCVPPDDDASNFKMAERTMLSRLQLKPAQVHRIRGEMPPQAGALEYENEIQRAFALKAGEFPRFDLVLLGLGDNSHTLSLFPGNPAVHEQQRLALAVEVDAPQPWRITLTPPVINHASHVMFMAAGKQKAQAVWNILKGPRDLDRYPAQAIAPESGDLIWLLDKEAASLIA